MRLYVNTSQADDIVTYETIRKRYIDINGSLDGFGTYLKNRCMSDSGEIEYVPAEISVRLEQGYFNEYDVTIIWEYTYLEERLIRERICGFYHGKPTELGLRQYAFKGVEGVLDWPGIYD